MKKLTMYLSMIAMATAVVSCSTDDVDSALSSGSSGSSNLEADAYLTVNIVTAATTRADAYPTTDGGEADASDAEDAVNSLLIVAFDSDYSYIAYATSDESETDGTWKFKLPSSSVNFFTVVNATDALVDNLDDIITSNANHTWSIMYNELMETISFYTASSLTQDGAKIDSPFIMVNAGAYNSYSTQNDILVLATSLVNGKLSTDATDASKLSVTVDRLTAKFTTTTEMDAVNILGDGDSKTKYRGMRLNATNRLGYIYSSIVKLSSTYYTDYRKDPNYQIKYDGGDIDEFRTTLKTNFNWMSNTPAENIDAYFETYNNNTSSTSGSTPEYVVENTAEGAYQDYNNLTQAIVRMEYNPNGSLITAVAANADGNLEYTLAKDAGGYASDAGSSAVTWFMINNSCYTLEGVQSYYAYVKGLMDAENNELETGVNEDGTVSNAGILELMDYQLRYTLQDATVTWESVTAASFTSKSNIGYIAATIPAYGTTSTSYQPNSYEALKDENAYVVAYYFQGVNYYDVFIQHDSSETPFVTGRWGMVRNNWYTLTINSVSGPGLPYIPDPTDPAITDPSNPDPTDPEPADTEYGYLDVTMTVSAWTTWTQDTVLGDDQSAM